MGNCTSLESKHQNDICAICNENIDIQKLLICVRCNISLHESCYDEAEDDADDDIETTSKKTYTKCPACKIIGSIGKFHCINSK
jgi:hypothetical protein